MKPKMLWFLLILLLSLDADVEILCEQDWDNSVSTVLWFCLSCLVLFCFILFCFVLFVYSTFLSFLN